MSSNDKNLSTSFNFFKKRKKHKSNKSNKSKEHLSPISNLSFSESYLNGSQNSRLTPLKYTLGKSGKRGSFRGLLSDFGTPASQASVTQNSTENDENDTIPHRPFINLELCKPYNYIFWMILGNNNIISMFNLEQQFIQQFKDIGKKCEFGYGIEKSINRVIYNSMKEIYESYRYLMDNQCQISNWSTVYLNSYLFLKPVNLTNFQYHFHTLKPYRESMEEEYREIDELESVIDNVNIGGEVISGPVFIHESLLQSFNNNFELLPSKISNVYDYKRNGVEYDYLHNLINRMLYDRALKQLIVVKSNVDIDSINLNLIEGFTLSNLKSGEKCWLPIYLSDKLSHDGFVTVELPQILRKEYLRSLRTLEEKSEPLQQLPNDYFFELTHIFTKSKLFKKLYIPNMRKNEDVYGYISKISGIVEDIRYTRLKKIYNFLENLEMQEKIIKLDNFQFSETHIINQYLSGYCSFDDRTKETLRMPWKQVSHLVSDLENNLMDSLNHNII
ncbi:GINS complex family protein [Theileria parva strain Muguga]|uniref:GINS complex family protein n=1 Tax=Theileria parva strain Muguga TaxID=333668 RepID=UPI001C6214B5|nr:GINS complex family protein [Theileria parva strain Muguga]EAN30664.2 GINS complex family protein [Theileria parva strain Muguga]